MPDVFARGGFAEEILDVTDAVKCLSFGIFVEKKKTVSFDMASHFHLTWLHFSSEGDWHFASSLASVFIGAGLVFSFGMAWHGMAFSSS